MLPLGSWFRESHMKTWMLLPYNSKTISKDAGRCMRRMRHGEYEQSSDDMIDEICRTGASGHDAASRGELEAALAPPPAPRKTRPMVSTKKSQT